MKVLLPVLSSCLLAASIAATASSSSSSSSSSRPPFVAHVTDDALKEALLKGMDALSETENIMIKLSLPTKVNLYKEVIAHPRCVRLVALSGGYSRDEANEILAKQTGMIASFSRALLEGLSYGQSQEDFDKTLGKTLDVIAEASMAG